MQSHLLEYIGFAASIIIALSMTMNSILKFRWINLMGAITFSTYGFLIGALPVGILNGFITLVDIYYLSSIYGTKHYFETLEVRGDNKYLLRFLTFHQKEIEHFFPGFVYKPKMNTMSFFVLRNMAVAGLVLAHRRENGELRVGLDYVVPQYRDYKNGKFVYDELLQSLTDVGIQKIVAEANSPNHIKYLKKLGFTTSSEGLMEKATGQSDRS
ncbi:MAG: hypothetical protein Q8O72_02215 [Bacteroidales bacterium]|nr:hypothetical protein [Bacteroidales bacterium]